MQPNVLDNLLQQNSSGLPVKDFLQQVVEEHPYFSPAHFFLLQQLDEADEKYTDQAAKTALLFNNPYWLQFKLQQQPVTAKTAPVIPMYNDNTDNDDDNAELLAGSGTTVEEEPAVIAAETPVELTAEETQLYTENTDNDDDNAVLVPGEETGIVETAPVLPGEETVPVTENETVPFAENMDNDDDNALLVNEENMPAGMPEVKIDLAASIKNAENEHALSFEPMHLVDYFASQGIKLSEEVQTADKLGKQLKSFTEWLKTMKKVHVPDAAASVATTEVAIQALAEKSNAENEIITEAMAEVFAQQGKAAKATELYQKLSLLNPAKSAYFAAKIENLKGQ